MLTKIRQIVCKAFNQGRIIGYWNYIQTFNTLLADAYLVIQDTSI